MKWKDHISLLSSKVSRAIGMIKYAKKGIAHQFIENVIFGGYLNLILDTAALFGVHVESLPAKH